MLILIKKYVKDLMTAVDGLSYSLTKFLALGGFGAMTAQFARQDVPDFLGYAIGVTVIMAALAGKYIAETKREEGK